MNSLAKLVFIKLVFLGQLYGSPTPQHFVTLLNQRQGYSGATSISGGSAGATVVALDRELGKKMNDAIGKHTQSVIQKSQENMQRTLANSENFSRRLQADINASVQRSLANTQATVAQALASAGLGLFPPNLVPNFKPEPSEAGFQNLFGIGDSFSKTLNADISKTIAESQAQSQKLQADIHKITSEAIHKAAKNGQLKVISTHGGGPLSLVSSSVNGQGIVLAGGQPGGMIHVVSESSSSNGGNPNLRIYSNVPIHVAGVEPHHVKGALDNRGPLPFPPIRKSATPPRPQHVYLPNSGHVRDNVIEPGH